MDPPTQLAIEPGDCNLVLQPRQAHSTHVAYLDERLPQQRDTSGQDRFNGRHPFRFSTNAFTIYRSALHPIHQLPIELLSFIIVLVVGDQVRTAEERSLLIGICSVCKFWFDAARYAHVLWRGVWFHPIGDRSCVQSTYIKMARWLRRSGTLQKTIRFSDAFCPCDTGRRCIMPCPILRKLLDEGPFIDHLALHVETTTCLSRFLALFGPSNSSMNRPWDRLRSLTLGARTNHHAFNLGHSPPIEAMLANLPAITSLSLYLPPQDDEQDDRRSAAIQSYIPSESLDRLTNLVTSWHWGDLSVMQLLRRCVRIETLTLDSQYKLLEDWGRYTDIVALPESSVVLTNVTTLRVRGGCLKLLEYIETPALLTLDLELGGSPFNGDLELGGSPFHGDVLRVKVLEFLVTSNIVERLQSLRICDSKASGQNLYSIIAPLKSLRNLTLADILTSEGVFGGISASGTLPTFSSLRRVHLLQLPATFEVDVELRSLGSRDAVTPRMFTVSYAEGATIREGLRHDSRVEVLPSYSHLCSPPTRCRWTCVLWEADILYYPTLDNVGDEVPRHDPGTASLCDGQLNDVGVVILSYTRSAALLDPNVTRIIGQPSVTFATQPTPPESPPRRSAKIQPPIPGCPSAVNGFDQVSRSQIEASQSTVPFPPNLPTASPPAVIPPTAFRLTRSSFGAKSSHATPDSTNTTTSPTSPRSRIPSKADEDNAHGHRPARPVPSRLNLAAISNHTPLSAPPNNTGNVLAPPGMARRSPTSPSHTPSNHNEPADGQAPLSLPPFRMMRRGGASRARIVRVAELGLTYNEGDDAAPPCGSRLLRRSRPGMVLFRELDRGLPSSSSGRIALGKCKSLVPDSEHTIEPEKLALDLGAATGDKSKADVGRVTAQTGMVCGCGGTRWRAMRWLTPTVDKQPKKSMLTFITTILYHGDAEVPNDACKANGTGGVYGRGGEEDANDDRIDERHWLIAEHLPPRRQPPPPVRAVRRSRVYQRPPHSHGYLLLPSTHILACRLTVSTRTATQLKPAELTAVTTSTPIASCLYPPSFFPKDFSTAEFHRGVVNQLSLIAKVAASGRFYGQPTPKCRWPIAVRGIGRLPQETLLDHCRSTNRKPNQDEQRKPVWVGGMVTTIERRLRCMQANQALHNLRVRRVRK
ncbi:hypothetical protein DFP72DRAFT_851148 [Ephemerocybe angulata]|uniref:F-box domain-containing protein n=1 Tax=Ephemerocybe angulata TaxID=980116 RepID=A0A8H6M4I9_9AGAR|nr:hypothetical protein DFP72DRAFT_851148 [Tulosesus angulatus]